MDAVTIVRSAIKVQVAGTSQAGAKSNNSNGHVVLLCKCTLFFVANHKGTNR